MIRLDTVDVSFTSCKALSNISLELTNQSGVVGLIGPNGAGKTTLMKLIFGFIRPIKGSITIKDSKLAYCPDVPSFEETLTADEVLQHSAALYGISVKDVEIKELLTYVGLQSVGKKLVKGFSRGMRQRLGIASVLLLDPDVIFLDEPTSALDPNGRIDILNLIKEIAKDKTIVISSQLLADLQHVASSLIILNKGKLLYQDSLENFMTLINKKIEVLCQDSLSRDIIKEVLVEQGVDTYCDNENSGRLYARSGDFEKIYPLLIPYLSSILSISRVSSDLTSGFLHFIAKKEGELSEIN